MVTFQDTALICKNGHVINASSIKYPEKNTKFCEKCGAEGIIHCSYCNAQIRGDIHYDGIYGGRAYSIPSYCHNCGKPYPWTTDKIEALKEIVELSGIDQDYIKEFNKNIEIIASDTPRTNLAAMKIRNISTKIATGIWNDIARPLIVDIASATAKKAMGL